MSVRTKLTLAFLAIASIPLLLVSALTYNNFKNSLESTRISSLRDIAAFKADKIETYFADLRGYIETTQDFYNIQKNLPILTRLAGEPNNPDFIAAKKMLDGQLPRMQSVLKLADIMLLNPEGKIVYASSSQYHSTDLLNRLPDPAQRAFEEGKNKIYFSDIFLYQAEDNRFEMLITAPAFDFNNVFIGVIAFEVDMAPIYKLVQDATGLGDTGETLLGKKKDHQVVYLNPLRHDPNAALKRIIDIGGKVGVPMQNAVQGKTAAGLYIDYRGKKVVAAWRYLPSLNWGMVAKIDAREAFVDVTNLRNLAVVILIIVIAISGILAFYVANSISKPIKRLSRGAEIIGSGNLDYKVGITSKDEIGQLSRVFDKMTEDLKTTTASRDELNKEVAERRQAQETLQKTSDDLMRSNKELEQFAYVSSHDLQEPLRVITGYIQLIAKRYKGRLDSDADEFINFAVDGASRMQSLITDLLTYSRVSKKAKPFAEFDCNQLLAEALANLEVAVKTADAVITHDPLPTIMADGTQLVQVFQNLIGNAIKFRSDKRPQIHITVKRNANKWVFSIKDNGIGIESAYKDKIFVIFQRLHSREEYPGTGIGLAICKKIVERHSGKIWLESTPGEGSTFHFTIKDKGD